MLYRLWDALTVFKEMARLPHSGARTKNGIVSQPVKPPGYLVKMLKMSLERHKLIRLHTISIDLGYLVTASRRADMKEMVGRGSGGRWPAIGVSRIVAFFAEYLSDTCSWLSSTSSLDWKGSPAFSKIQSTSLRYLPQRASACASWFRGKNSDLFSFL